MFVDQCKIYVKAGDGGNGSVSFRREKYVPFGGPDGGDGGNGGDVVFEVSLHLSTLIDLRYPQHYIVKPAGAGGGKKCSGKHSPDRVIPVPIGTIVRDHDTKEILADLCEPEQRVVVAKGGRGGRGNTHFKTATHQTPRTAEQGEIGEERWLWIELKLLADVGLLGFPNAGKSSLMAALTHAHPKIADYPFTTLEPNLGVATWQGGGKRMEHFTVADVPGLIEGAHEGKGLGIQFLKHLERTSILLHLVDVSETASGDPIHDFEVIREEVDQYSGDIRSKPFMVVGTKIDIAGEGAYLARLRRHCESKEIPFFEISSATGQGTKALLQSLGPEIKRLRSAAVKILSLKGNPE